MFKFLLKLFGIKDVESEANFGLQDLKFQDSKFDDKSAKSSNYKFINLDIHKLDRYIVNLVPQELLERYNVIAVGVEDNRIKLAMADPDDILAIDDIRLVTGFDIEPLQAEESAIKRAINKIFYGIFAVNEIDLDKRDYLSDEAPIVLVFNLIISQAIADKAEEIHMIGDEEPDTLIIYYIINGVKHEVMQPPNHIKNKIINHAKVIANLDILKKKSHQDGKISFRYEGIRHEAVITVVPSVNGNDENIIIKILN